MVALVVMASGGGVLACLDVTPITGVEAPNDASALDVSVPEPAEAGACLRCSSGASEAGASCRAVYAACQADPKCLSMFLCGIPRGCYAPGSNVVECLTACGAAAGINGTSDPAIAPFLGLYGCATGTCSSACSSP